MKEVETSKKPKTKESEGDAKKEEKKDGDGDGKERSKEKKKCKSCGKDSTDDGEKKGQDKAKKDGGDSDKKFEEKRSDNSREKEKNNDGGGSGGWTREQDKKLKEMKEAYKSWKEIAAEVGHHQSECKKHWKGLEKAGEEKSGGDRSTEGGSGWDNEWGSGGGGDGGDLSFGDLFVDESEKQNNTNNSSGGNGGNNQKDSNGDNGNGRKQYQAGNEGWSYKSNKPSEPTSRPRSKLQTNDVWSKDDCEVLEALEAQYREHKWLQIQANFFNWTGRMISAELIENKFREDEAL